MVRPKKEESIRRTSNVMVRFSNIEYELVAGYAKDAGYPISTFVRKQALSEKVTVNYNIVADLGEIQNLTVQAAGIEIISTRLPAISTAAVWLHAECWKN